MAFSRARTSAKAAHQSPLIQSIPIHNQTHSRVTIISQVLATRGMTWRHLTVPLTPP